MNARWQVQDLRFEGVLDNSKGAFDFSARKQRHWKELLVPKHLQVRNGCLLSGLLGTFRKLREQTAEFGSFRRVLQIACPPSAATAHLCLQQSWFHQKIVCASNESTPTQPVGFWKKTNTLHQESPRRSKSGAFCINICDTIAVWVQKNKHFFRSSSTLNSPFLISALRFEHTFSFWTQILCASSSKKQFELTQSNETKDWDYAWITNA